MSFQSAAGRQRGRLAVATAISLVLLLIEVVVGLAANSLALLADAGHLFADVSGMVISLGAVWVAGRASGRQRSYGLYRLEILAAAANALLLLAVSALIIYEALRRLAVPPEIQPVPVMLVALIALIANSASALLLFRGQKGSLTIRAAFLEVSSDLLGAFAVLMASLIIALTGFVAADAIASLLIGLLILPRTWTVLRDSLDVLLESTPKGVNLDDVQAHILEAPGVQAVHDLHAWTITSGMNVVSAHVVLGEGAQPGDILDRLALCLSDDFDIDHSTFQLETPEHVVWEGRSEHVQH